MKKVKRKTIKTCHSPDDEKKYKSSDTNAHQKNINSKKFLLTKLILNKKRERVFSKDEKRLHNLPLNKNGTKSFIMQKKMTKRERHCR